MSVDLPALAHAIDLVRAAGASPDLRYNERKLLIELCVAAARGFPFACDLRQIASKAGLTPGQAQRELGRLKARGLVRTHVPGRVRIVTAILIPRSDL